MINRREFLKSAAAVTALGVVATTTHKYHNNDNKKYINGYPFYNEYQRGIIEDKQKYLTFLTCDFEDNVDRNKVKNFLQRLTDVLNQLITSGTVDINNNKYKSQHDTGESYDLDYSYSTVTVGFGNSFFDKFNITSPMKIKTLPPFTIDYLNKDISDGDICFQICSNNQQCNFHVARVLLRDFVGIIKPRWMENGFDYKTGIDAKGTSRNLMGFKDGTNNIKGNKDFSEYVFNQNGINKYSTFLVVRKIRMVLDSWDRNVLKEQENTFGRCKYSGAPLNCKYEHDKLNFNSKDSSGELIIPIDAHVRLAHVDNSKSKLLRRGYSYNNGLDKNTQQLDAGLLFISYQRDIEQFINIQRSLDKGKDKLHEYIKHVVSGVFYCPPGVQKGKYIGSNFV